MKPMKAEAVTAFDKIAWPKLLSPKLDGFRCVMRDGVALTNSLKPIENRFVQAWASQWASQLHGLDGELIVGEHDEDVYNRTTSGLRRRDGEPDFSFHVFDNWDLQGVPYSERQNIFRRQVLINNQPRLHVVSQVQINNPLELQEWEEYYLAHHYEGVMLRDPNGLYKYGRSTEKEGTLVKVKRFTDTECTIVGYTELMHNENEAKRDAVGRTKRSTDSAGLVPAGTLGALVCRWKNGLTFEVGTGPALTAAGRAELWAQRNTLAGQQAKVKYFEPGTIDRPRHPVLLGLRAPEDMSE